MIAFAPSWASVLREMSDAGGKPQPLTRLEKGEFSHRWPEFLPGAKAVLFSTTESSFNWANANVAVETLGTGERRNLVQSATHPRYAASGHLVYAQGGNLMAVPFDHQQLVVMGAEVAVVEGVLQSRASRAALYSLSDTGTLADAPVGR